MANVPERPEQRTKFFVAGDRSAPEIKELLGTGGGGGGVGGSGFNLNENV